MKGKIVGFFVFSNVEPSVYKAHKMICKGDFISCTGDVTKNIKLVLSLCNTKEIRGTFSNSSSWESIESLRNKGMGSLFRSIVDGVLSVVQATDAKDGNFINDKSFLLRYTTMNGSYEYIEAKSKGLK